MNIKKLLLPVLVLNLCVWSLMVYGGDFKKVWDGGIGGEGSDPPNFIRAYGVLVCNDIDKNGENEFASYDGTAKRIVVWEAVSDNDYDVVWHKDKNTGAGGASILRGGERSLMCTDLDEDGNLELVMVWDSWHPDSTNGFNALEVYEHDPNSGEFLPQEPTISYDPPRDTKGQVKLEYQSQAKDVDNDGVVELLLTNRGKSNINFTIVSLPGKDFANPDWTVEYCDSTTTSDSSRYGLAMHAMSVGDLDNNGLDDMLISVDGTRRPIWIYSATAANTYEITVFDTMAYPHEYEGTQARMMITDFNEDGNNEVYIGARNGAKVWVVDNITNIANAFQRENFHLLEDINLLEGGGYSGVHLRGGILGDADNNGRPNFYLTVRNPLDAIYDFEWIGGAGGDVTDPDNYLVSKLYHDDDTDLENDIVALDIGDLDGDGMDHQDIVFVTGKTNTGVAPGIFVTEYDATNLGLPPDLSANVPAKFALKQNYPNPFNPTTSIAYDLSKSGVVKLAIHNILGQEVRTLVNGHQSAGNYFEMWDGSDDQGYMLTSGIYMYKLEVNGFQKTMKMLLIK
ncbi:T9SS type A sorting domain-containing protein [bacterium]|nr:T9SS type A sorting domain-containing protein [bacterium]